MAARAITIRDDTLSAACAGIAGVGQVCIFMQSDPPFTASAASDVAFFRRAQLPFGVATRLAGLRKCHLI